MGLFSRTPAVITDEKAVDELLTRGVAEVIVKEDLRKKLLSGKRLRIKLGIDPTSPDLHIGRAVPLLKLRDFQKLGHQIVFIVGDFTAVIGDTSDKESERPMLAREVIEKNKQSYFAQAGKILDFSQVEMRYNSEWLKKLTYREIGEHADLFSVADFVARENIARRLEAGKRVSLRELLYPLMQGYDSVAIQADVELGGTDQKFNVLAGRPLQEHFGQAPQNVVLNPLIDGLDGTKMSSSKGNVIALTAAPADMYGKVMSMADEQVKIYFELCTRVPMGEVEKIASGHPKDAKMRLAREIVAMYHGDDAAMTAETDWQNTFSKGEVPHDIPTLHFGRGIPWYALLLSDQMLELVRVSKTEMRRLVEQGAISEIGGQKIKDINSNFERPTTLRIGKHRFVKLEFL
ncbi:MAG TPA: tyrosine--tRNA ligase [Candidatus Paceibacterota bacterium]|nr:tyrosine--tRNA ligase [Candidatus Paceibacterota bacterium]